MRAYCIYLQFQRLSRLSPVLTNCGQVRHFSPRRALLYVPGDDERKLRKALSLQVDCIAMDCEDGVALNKKDAARSTISKLLAEGRVSLHQPEWSVRINSIESGLCTDDLSAILSGPCIPPTILLPKVDEPSHVEWFADRITDHLKERSGNPRMNLIMYIESAQAVLNMRDICAKAQDLSTRTSVTPVALVFGSDDLCASLGTARSEDANEMMYARQKIVLVAKAFHLQAIDMVHIKYKDLEGLKHQCELGARLGFTGKQVIHPGQVPVVQNAFLPTPDQVKWACEVVAAFEDYQKEGKGAFVFKGSMIDMPSIKQAQNILKLSKEERTDQKSPGV